MRMETPEFIQIFFDKSKVVKDVQLTHIVWQKDWPNDRSQRQPGIIYLPDMDCTERDEALGRFIAAWNRVERQIRFLISTYLNADISMASAIYDLGLSVQQITNLLTTAASNRLNPQEARRLSNWLRRYGELNTKRNRLVHGDWACHLDLGTDENGLIEIIDYRWERTFSPADKKERDKLQNNEKNAITKYRFSILKIIHLCDQAKHLEEDAANLPYRSQNSQKKKPSGRSSSQED